MIDEQRIEFAKDIILKCGDLALQSFGKENERFEKGVSDMTTSVDLEVEKIMIDSITATFPGEKILSEERGIIGKDSPYVWIIDPIDGTINYYHGIPLFRIGLCLCLNDEAVMSFIYDPVNRELFSAVKNNGAKLNGKTISVSRNSDLKKSILLTHLSSKKEARGRTIACLENIFSNVFHMRMIGCGMAAMTYLAQGKVDIFFNVQTNVWDIISGALLISEAGGKVTDIEGKAINLQSTSVLASNGLLHDQMFGLLHEM